jgi:hypothetical protein
MPRGRKHMTHIEREQCIVLYSRGMTLDRLAEIFDRDRRTVERLVRRRSANRGRWRAGNSS